MDYTSLCDETDDLFCVCIKSMSLHHLCLHYSTVHMYDTQNTDMEKALLSSDVTTEDLLNYGIDVTHLKPQCM